MTKDEILKKLEGALKRKRYDHSVGVAYTAAFLAIKYNYDMDTAYIAGLLHDCGKYMSDSESLDYCKKHKIEISEVEKEVPALLHAKIGQYIAKKEYNIDSDEILMSIRWHTTGRKDMSLLEKIIFTADYIEPNRTHDPDLLKLRELAFKDLDLCIVKIYENTLKYIAKSKKTQDPTTLEAYNFYRELVLER